MNYWWSKMDFIDRQHPPTLRPLLILKQRVELSISGKGITSSSTIASTRVLPTISSRLGFQWCLHLGFRMLKHGIRVSKLTSGSHATWVKRFSRFSKVGHTNSFDLKSNSRSLTGQGILANILYFSPPILLRLFVELWVVGRMRLSYHAYVVESNQVSRKNS